MKKDNLILVRIFGFIFLILGILFTILGTTTFDMDLGILIPGIILIPFSVAWIVMSFIPNIMRMSIKIANEIQNENKNELQEIATTASEINSEAIKTTARSVKEGLQKDTKYCKECGAEIDSDSKYCKECGAKN